MNQEIAGSNPARGIDIKCSCDNNVIYGIVKNNKIRKLTFSQDLAEFIQIKNPDHEIWKLDLIIGKDATKDSKNCIFGILSLKTGKLLRAAVTFEEADWLCQDSSRRVVECFSKNSIKWK